MTGVEIEHSVRNDFPDGFVWGTATASYQIEGATAEDGRGTSIWDTFSRMPGKTLNGDTGEIANDHFHRFRDDVALMRDLGLNAYRFSVAWPRIQPNGQVEQRGLDFYRRLVDELNGAGIEPYVTLYHWDLPQHLEDAGGWPARDTAYRFAEYAQLVHGALGDRVTNWLTVNEPWCAAFLGYASGDHAPGRRDPADSLKAAHHLLLGHGLATSVLRGPGTKVGLATNLYAISPATDSEEDQDAARRIDGLQNRLFLDAVLRGEYPVDVRADVAHLGFDECVREGDLDLIGGPIDLLGINYYSRHTVSAVEGGHVATSPFAGASPWPGSEHVSFVNAGRPVTDMGWEVDPEGLHEILTRVVKEYPAVPLFITENGAAYPDEETEDGVVDDQDRVAYLESHLLACREAISDGAPLKGYFAWSFMDNYEWSWGYAKRFGLVHVDFETLVRTPKTSARWFGDVARHNGLL